MAVGDLVSKSYSPTVNELLTNLQSLSPELAQFLKIDQNNHHLETHMLIILMQQGRSMKMDRFGQGFQELN